jgi:hypothetical protein
MKIALIGYGAMGRLIKTLTEKPKDVGAVIDFSE